MYYNSLELNDDTLIYRINKIEGLDDCGLRETRENRADSHGQFDYGQYLAERLISIYGEINASTKVLRNRYRQNLLNASIKNGVYYWLYWQLDDEIQKGIYCKVFEKNIPEEIYPEPN